MLVELPGVREECDQCLQILENTRVVYSYHSEYHTNSAEYSLVCDRLEPLFEWLEEWLRILRLLERFMIILVESLVGSGKAVCPCHRRMRGTTC